MGASVGAAVDTDGRFAFTFSFQKGVGGGATVGIGGGVQKGSLMSVEGGTGDLNFHKEDATTLTIAAGEFQPSFTLPGRGQNWTGAGAGGAARPWGLGAGVFVTQSQTKITTPTAPIVQQAREAASSFMKQATQAMTCPFGCKF